MKKKFAKIFAWLNSAWKWFDRRNDKVKHFVVCFVGSFVFGYGFGIGAGLAAEYKDRAWGGFWGWDDLVADALGTVAGSVVRYLIFGRA